MVRIIFLIFLSISISVLISCSPEKSKPEAWVWSHPHKNYSNQQWDSVLSLMENAGIKNLLLGADSANMQRVLPLAKKHQVKVHAWIWTMNRNDAPKEWLSVNALGQSLADQKAYVDYYKFMCPAVDSVEEFILKKFKPYLEMKGLYGIHMDYIRYVDVILPLALQPKYHLDQKDILPRFDYGYHPAMLKKFEQQYAYSPYSIDDYAHDSLWLQFRLDQLNILVNSLAQKVKATGKEISAAVFPEPDLSVKMVRQQWNKWNLDAFFPMIYYNFYNEDIEWMGEMISSDLEKTGAPINCGLYLPGIKSDEEFEQAIKTALESGASGVSFFELGGLSHRQFHIIGRYFSD